MTVLHLVDETEAADLAAFLARLLHYDRGAAVRLQAAGTALAVFGRPPSFEVLAVRAVRLAKPYENGLEVTLDVTVSAGELLESVSERAATAAVPGAVTGPPWAGVLPPRGGWRTEPGLPAPDALRATVAAAVGEFRARTEELAPELRTRAELDRIGRDIWSRETGHTRLPVRAVHAAQSLGFLRPGTEAADTGLLASGAWLRLRTPYGSIAVRRAGALGSLGALGVSVSR
ncbi:hypothetical protein [Streptomyces malaysiense]|uniref:Uncharacterized protein n=1 Tax=Streptomyces malaysiense TaxID=1428626 RepID=A0A1J4PU12_9ACTN|nr:hypothetical protein [Streptomyces malaysiense]OIK23455.1 hypothetical protein VT52_032590 [Streptomyces malaysiense]